MRVPRSRLLAAVICILLTSTGAWASGPFQAHQPPFEVIGPPVPVSERDPRAGASVLAIVLGPFGAHRLYLGTSPKVAVIYGLTFGGFGILPLIDLGHLLFAKDLERFRNNDQLLMWRAPREAAVTPP